MDAKLQAVQQIISEVKRAVIGKDEVITQVMTCILARGHILIDDIPGVGKTTLALAFSRAMELKQKRIQFTPDVMPSDVTGFTMFDKTSNKFVYRPGAVICNLLLADEINRTSAKTQSALLEAMEEGRVTVDSKVYRLANPFIVIATQNPVGSIGTHMLPESQLDRFFIKITMGYPSVENEVTMLKDKHGANPIDEVRSVISADDLVALQNAVEEVFVHDAIYDYIVRLADQTRNHPDVRLGVSPRGSIALCRMAKADAFIRGNDFVSPENVLNVIHSTWNHRILLNPKAGLKSGMTQKILDEIVDHVQVKTN